MLEAPDALKCVKTDLKSADAINGDMLNYQAFVVALVKVANLVKSKLNQEDEGESDVS